MNGTPDSHPFKEFNSIALTLYVYHRAHFTWKVSLSAVLCNSLQKFTLRVIKTSRGRKKKLPYFQALLYPNMYCPCNQHLIQIIIICEIDGLLNQYAVEMSQIILIQ